ncbi:hypothetical protein GCM10010919_20880 [Alishewanella longhuensis]|uniref:Solute-binding protein family 3/N-terminal domain-containing protein n=1 Tax=Alishewanella longhuensis TaxID=1091037 RepID=A0ABQ3KYF8_9ALTE|nr:transporter substrate-binding domain-containing protein [Alishewanella longhuensis]GHG70321.1 hypothetical protein GCM10010919_20880 [Alishewanella longhuensis]
MRPLVLAIAFIIGCFPAYSCTFRFGNEISFRPFIELQDNNWQGLTVELLQMLVQDVGCALEFIPSPWLRSLRLIEQGELDVLTHLTYNHERAARFAFIGPHHLESIYLVAVADAFPGVSSIGQLSSKGAGFIALLNGAYYGQELDAMMKHKRTQEFFIAIVSNQDKLLLLANGRVQGGNG